MPLKNPKNLLLTIVVAAACSVPAGLAVCAAEALPAEAELIAVLRSDASEADKALVCKKLAIKGSAAAVGDLAKLLANERLASWHGFHSRRFRAPRPTPRCARPPGRSLVASSWA
jgi:fructose-specific component phosphotransferase system IIB-like protein